MPSWEQLLIYSPLGIIGAWRWGVWLWQKIFQFFYRPLRSKPGWRQPTLSIVTPVYNEDPELFREALDSWSRNRPHEIIAVIDDSDTACIGIFKTFASKHPEAKLIITDEPGKRPALGKGARAARGEIIALVDSDTLWDTDIRDTLLQPFTDPNVGGVTPRQAVLNPDTLAKKLFSIRLDLRYLHEFRYLSVMGDALTCLSGRTAIYRSVALLPVIDQMIHETFWGKPCISGEDKRLTSLVLGNGWKIRYQQNAVVRTPGNPRLSTFFLQSLRWGRNSWRTDLRMLGSGWTWRREPFFAYHLFDRAVQPFTLLLGPIYLGIALSLQHSLAAAILISWWIVSRTVRIFPHLRQAPQDIFFVPFYVMSQYPLAILKIYALFTLNYQTWITRWHQIRVERFGFFRLLLSRVATAFVVGGLAFSVTQYQYARSYAAEIERAKKAPLYTEDFSRFALDEKERAFYAELAAHRSGTYVTRPGDTPQLLARKYNLSPETIATLFPGRPSYVWLLPGQKLTFPVEALTRSYDAATLKPIASKPPVITYDAATDTINVKGKGNVMTIPSIATALNRPFVRQPALLVETAPKEWLLRSNLRIAEGVTLIIDQEQVSWLKLASSSKGFVSLNAYNGGILMKNTKITSWDEEKNAPDLEYADGRAYVSVRANGRMDVLDSEIAYLGYPRSTEIAQGKRVGGVYGLAWKIPNGTFGQYLLTGNVIGNRIHDNYFGIYTFGTTGMIIRGNELYGNVQYGIDPHDDSNNLLIENNFIHDNGNHGIIVSKRVVYSMIRNNRSVDNRLHGIMLDRQSDYNLVEGNTVSGNVNGLALYDSHHNLIQNNAFSENRYGIRANALSSENRFQDNIVRDSEKGVFLYGGATKNIVIDNRIASNAQGVSLKEASENIILRSLQPNDNTVSIKIDERSRGSNFIERIE